MQKFVRETNSQKWSSKAITNEQYVLTIADMDFALPNHFKKAIINKIQLTNNFTYKSLSKQYCEAIINWYSHRHIRSPKIKIYPQDIVEAPSILNIIYLSIQHFTKEGDGVLITTPIFAYYRKIILQLKRRPVQSRLYNERKANITRYDINFADLEQKAKQCKLMIFCNPHNPTGRLWNKRQTEKVVSICKNNNLLLISDQILCDLVPQKYLSQFYSLANSDYENIIICNSISKAFNAQSLKGGYAIIKNKEIRDKYNHIIDSLSIHLNQIAMGVTEIYYTQQGRDWIQKTNEIIQKNYDYLLEKLKNTMLILSKFEGTYLIVLNFEGYVKYIQRWWFAQSNRIGKFQNIVKTFLSSKKILANDMNYPGIYNNINTQFRFAIGVEYNFFKRFVEVLVSALWQVEYDYREIDAKL